MTAPADRQIVGLLATVMLLISGCAGARVTEVERMQARASFEQGVALLDQREWAMALIALERANALHPDMPIYLNAAGVSHLQQGNPERALTEFQRAVQLDPGYATAQLNLGIALAELGRWAEAVEAYERSIALPTLATPFTAYHNLGLALIRLGRYPQAEAALRFAVNLDPDVQLGWYHLGFALAAKGPTDEARAAFRKARDLQPDSAIGQAAAAHLKALGEGG